MKNEIKKLFGKKYYNFVDSKYFKNFSKIAKKRTENSKQNDFPSIEEDVSNLLRELELNTFNEINENLEKENLNDFINQKNEVIFINNKLKQLENIKISDSIIINKKHLAKCLSINEKISTFVLFERLK